MNLAGEYHRDTRDALPTRVAGHFRNATVSLALCGLGAAAPTEEHLTALAQDLGHMTSDALRMQPGIDHLHQGDILQLLLHMNTTLTSVSTQMTNLDGRVTNLTTQVIGLTTQVTTLNTRVTALDARVTNLDGRVTGLDDRMAGLTRTMAFSTNANAFILAGGVFISFPNAEGVVPENFPRTHADLMGMEGTHMTALLQAYNVNNIPHAIQARRERVCQLLISGN